MSGVNPALGPLELVDGRWVMGDALRPGGTWVEFRTDGLYRHSGTPEGELIPWSRVMLGMGVTIGGGYPSKGGNFTLPGLLCGLPWFRGRGTGHLDMTLRHPYEDWRIDFHRHPRWYRMLDVAVLEQLLTQTVAAHEAERLGDADWLGRVIGRLAAPTTSWSRSIQKTVQEARQAEEPTGA
ncbi:hypothetical protein ACWFRJ_06770 [Streptomyces sp. NPDC055239]